MTALRSEEIEALAEQRLMELEKHLGVPLAPPIPIDLLAEKVLGLDFLWDKVDEGPGQQILGCLDAQERLIILNETHRGLFEGKPGLERSTKGHEMGHWDLFIRPRLTDSPALLESETHEALAYRGDPLDAAQVTKLLKDEKGAWDLMGLIHASADDPQEKSAVNRYAAAISMPKAMLLGELDKYGNKEWATLYKLAAKFGVTISALKVRLEQLGVLAVGQDKKIYNSKEEAAGQMLLI
jgi:hypothetical protein